VKLRAANPAELAAVCNVLDGALLAVDTGGLARSIDAGDVLVAADSPEGPLLGVLVLEGTEIRAVAVRRRRRGQGIATALVAAAAAERELLVAEFDERVRPFWESVGFCIEALEGTTRLRGVRRT